MPDSSQKPASTLRLGLIQMACSDDRDANVARAEVLVREAAAGGARLVLLPELFEYLYWPQVELEAYFELANPAENHPFLPRFEALARELGVVLPISFFERAGPAHFNSLAMIDADGTRLGVYRKSHIPDGPGYEEKYYFNPGDTGFRAWPTQVGTIGVGICWDQWFPECARAMTLRGAEVLLYPTAIGSEPADADGSGGLDTRDMWQRAMVGHAVSNSCFVAASNRVGREGLATFYGSSFVADPMGEKLAEADRMDETIVYADLDLASARRFRAGFGFFRDRRPDLYRSLLTLDGREG
ncbi:N-carbamoylputrescine amidase [soil metagenome]|nr:N-carbamoylputrescine amidase [Trueperaceae bacterium]